MPFPGGRLQCLNIGWDVEKKTWYRLPPYDVTGHDDWLHWTKGSQTWNGMCAECHSTDLKKGFSMEKESYNTSWSGIDVGCEACHGPGSEHLTWAARPEMAREQAVNAGLTVDTGTGDNRDQITICAPCHSRRYQLGDNNHHNKELLDIMVPSLLTSPLYYPDGQILEEVYVYGSFSQSKMYQHDIRCSDCHDMHSLALHKPDNELCTQCHRKDDYDTPRHHFHKSVYQGKPSEGHLCVKCHMPGRIYMGIDYRPDHSLRIPRPDLSLELGVPNSCSANGCHEDKPLDWVIEKYQGWYGTAAKPHYGQIFSKATDLTPGLAPDLIRIADDTLLPVIVRATALELLNSYPQEATTDTFLRALESPDALLRHTAIRHLPHIDNESKARFIAPKLYDHVKAVRIEAAAALAALPKNLLRDEDKEIFESTLAEYRKTMLYNADFAPQRFNLANLESALGNDDKAISLYKQSLEIDSLFYPARVNLAMLLNRNGDNEEAAKHLEQVVRNHPELYRISYSLGLLLAEMNQFRQASIYLERAADGMPEYTRARYNLALTLMKLRRWEDAEKALLTAVTTEPENTQYFSVLANFYLNSGRKQRALQLAKTVLKAAPNNGQAQQLLRSLE